MSDSSGVGYLIYHQDPNSKFVGLFIGADGSLHYSTLDCEPFQSLQQLADFVQRFPRGGWYRERMIPFRLNADQAIWLHNYPARFEAIL